MEATVNWPLQRAARTFGQRTAVIDGERRLTYAELARRVAGLGGALSGRLALGRGAVCCVLAENSLEHLELCLAIPGYGFVLNDLNFRLAVAELAFIASDSGARILFVDAERLEAAREVCELVPSIEHLVLIGGTAQDGCLAYDELVSADPLPAPELDPESLAVICYTGGTTGNPKGVMQSHRNLIANAKHNSMEPGFHSSDVYLHAAPMFHSADASVLLCITWCGATHAIVPRFDAARVAAVIPELGVTVLLLIPTMLRLLVAELDERPVDLSSLRVLIYAGSPISPELQREIVLRMDCDCYQGYGMTEACPSVTWLTAEDHRRGVAAEDELARRHFRSVGVPLRGVQVEIRNLDREPVSDDEIGEIWVRGPNVMMGYWNRPEETAAALVDGWYRTGDAGYMDEYGFLYVVDRVKDMIVSGGENVYSVEVERALASHPLVREAAVFGVPSERWGESVYAVVSVSADAEIDEAALQEHCRTQIARYKVPRTIELRTEDLPKSEMGKILKKELRAAHWAGRDRLVSGA